MEIQLLESKTYQALSNLQKVHAALSLSEPQQIPSAPPQIAGLLGYALRYYPCSREGWKIASSHFHEVFEGCDSIDSPKAISEVHVTVQNHAWHPRRRPSFGEQEAHISVCGRQTEALRSVAQAGKNRHWQILKRP